MRRTLGATVTGLLVGACVSLPDPSALVGDWSSTGAPATLELEAKRWSLDSGGLVKEGVFEISGDRIALVLEETSSPAYDRYCRETVDLYRWWLDDGRLVIRPIEGQATLCDEVAASVLQAGPWERGS